ncbi:MAG: hypothetical protein IJZ26_01665 [Clostridia bacterium]|nr:hypothetical protein [Clostridia bacterium]
MNKKEREVVYANALEVFGMQCQYDQCMEEMAELMVAINKLKRQENYGEYKNNLSIKENFFEELADVYICIEGLAYLIGEPEFNKKVEEKMQKFARIVENCKPQNK